MLILTTFIKEKILNSLIMQIVLLVNQKNKKLFPIILLKKALNYTAKSSQIYSAYGNEIIIKILPFNIPNFEKPQSRKLPVQIDYPIFKTDTLEYLIPEGFEITKDLVGLEINNKYGKYGINYITDNNTILVIKYLLIKSGNYETDEYFNFFSFINEINKNEKKSYIIIKRNNQ